MRCADLTSQMDWTGLAKLAALIIFAINAALDGDEPYAADAAAEALADAGELVSVTGGAGRADSRPRALREYMASAG